MTAPSPQDAPLSRRLRRLYRRARRLVREPHRIAPAVRRRVRSPWIPAAERGRRAPEPAPASAPRPAQQPLTRAQRRAIITGGVDLTSLGLEIGPSHNPLLRKSEGYNIRIADHLDQAGLIEKYSYRQTQHIEEVDYVLKPGRITDSIPDRFDYIVASHVAEHTVCLISFLQDCEQLLEPGGALCLALPDMRYCFDRFRERTSLGRIIDVYHSGQLLHTEGMIVEHFYQQVELGGAQHWPAGAPGDYRLRSTSEVALAHAARAAAGEYVDTHNWVFTPNHFRLLLHDLRAFGYTKLRERAFTDTIYHEFFITLALDAPPTPTPTHEELIELSARDLLALDNPHFA